MSRRYKRLRDKYDISQKQLAEARALLQLIADGIPYQWDEWTEDNDGYSNCFFCDAAIGQEHRLSCLYRRICFLLDMPVLTEPPESEEEEEDWLTTEARSLGMVDEDGVLLDEEEAEEEDDTP